MIDVELANQIISEIRLESQIEEIDIVDCHNRILKQNIFADRSNPPFDRITMDGIAINYLSLVNGIKTFKIEDIQKAGEPQKKLLDNNKCLEVMTGATLPLNCDCVIKIEDLEIINGYANLKDNLEIKEMQNIHLKGSDYQKDDLLINENTKILSTHIGIIASVGLNKIKVFKNSRIAIISTGDELVKPSLPIETHQIYMSNSYALNSAIKSLGDFQTEIFHIKDETDILYSELTEILNDFDILILSGGVSMGKFDYLPQVLESLNVEKLFHKISQKPGKPMWFGKFKNKPIFALPGNPISALVCFYKYIKPFISNNYVDEYVILNNDFTFKPNLTCFQPVKITNIKGSLFADTVLTNTSGDFYSLNNSDGFIELEKSESLFKRGHIAKFFKW